MTLDTAELCKQCGGKCCRHYPHIFDTEMYRLEKLRPEISGRFVHVFGRWWKFSEPCLFFNEETGCTIEPYEDRPIICRLFPFAPVPCTDGWILPLHVAECEQWQVFGHKYKEAEAMFLEFLHENGVAAETKKAEV